MCTLYESMNILLINDIYELEVAKFMYGFYHRMLPENFDNCFKSENTQHSHNTGSIASESYHLERATTKTGQWAVVMYLYWSKHLEQNTFENKKII